MTIPQTIEAITPDLLGAVLGADVAAATSEVIGEGVGLLGTLHRVHLEYARPETGHPPTVIVKLPAEAEQNRQLGIVYGLYAAELHFYRDVAPSAAVRVPRAYHVEMDQERGEFLLVLEDLSRFDAADQVAGMTPAQALAAVEGIAPFHAQWHGSPDLASLTWLPDPDDPVRRAGLELFTSYWPVFEERWGHLVPNGGLEIGAAVRDLYEPLAMTLDNPPFTLIHGDYRVDNLFFGRPGGDEPLCVIDWQKVGVGPGAYDVANLLTQSMTLDDRRRHEASLLRAWHDRFVAAGGSGLSFDDVVRDYATCVLVNLILPVGAGAGIELANERAEALVRGMVERAFGAAIDQDWKAILAPLG